MNAIMEKKITEIRKNIRKKNCEAIEGGWGYNGIIVDDELYDYVVEHMDGKIGNKEVWKRFEGETK